MYLGLEAIYITNPRALRVIFDYLINFWEKEVSNDLRQWYWQEIVLKNDIKANVVGSSTMTREEKKYYDKICKIVDSCQYIQTSI
ncbi:hypothetical protein OXYTRIMIC_600 [Oxytricha trifallax]|uniref:Uncharacterized protein n=1 Tax=Oxytricha trifallax TaxID=1172189 RepID=A0A073HZH5_9SPIT|nr:hypothetical protein OXYTRIMIC_600 [Oxytricha trifallax]